MSKLFFKYWVVLKKYEYSFQYDLGHGGGAVLLPGFAISWFVDESQVTTRPHLCDPYYFRTQKFDPYRSGLYGCHHTELIVGFEVHDDRINPLGECILIVRGLWRCDLNRFLLICAATTRANERLTHWGWDEIDAILHTTFSNALSRMKMYEFHLRFHWSAEYVVHQFYGI